MDVDFDFSDVDSFFDEGEWEVEKKMIDVGDEAVKYAEEHGDYQDHTLTLRTSNDYDVDKDGLTLKNEAEYASFVESKGFDVLSSAALYAENKGLVKSEIEENESYKLGYHTRTEYGYESWSPKVLFEESYREVKKETPICFGDAIEVLKQGGTIRRKGWNGKGLMVFKQVPAHIESDVIPKMQSLPQSAKDLILKGKGFIDYTSQCLIYNENTGRADSWVPSISDVFAEDWEIVK